MTGQHLYTHSMIVSHLRFAGRNRQSVVLSIQACQKHLERNLLDDEDAAPIGNVRVARELAGIQELMAL